MTQKRKHKRALRIFLSYAAADKAEARKLLHSLLSQRPDLQIFTTETLSAGEDWESRLKQEISQCDIFVVVITRHSVDSAWVLQQLGAAWALNKPIIPVVTNRSIFSRVPVALSQVHSIKIKDLEKPEVIERILDYYEEVMASRNGG